MPWVSRGWRVPSVHVAEPTQKRFTLCRVVTRCGHNSNDKFWFLIVRAISVRARAFRSWRVVTCIKWLARVPPCGEKRGDVDCAFCIWFLFGLGDMRSLLSSALAALSPPFFSFHSCYFGASKLTSLPIPGWIAQLNYHDWNVYVGLNFNLTTTHRTRFVRGADRLFWQKFLIPHYQVVEVNLSTLENSCTCPISCVWYSRYAHCSTSLQLSTNISATNLGHEYHVRRDVSSSMSTLPRTAVFVSQTSIRSWFHHT